MSVYIFLDSNIYIRYLTQGQPGCEPVHFQELVKLITDGAARLLVPEVVRLEIEKFLTHMEGDFSFHFKKAREELESRAKAWNEMSDVKDTLLKALDDAERRKKENVKRHYEKVQALFRLGNAESISFTPDLWFRGKRRIIAGRMPYWNQETSGEKKADKHDRENDACIVESLLSYFEAHKPEGAILCLKDIEREKQEEIQRRQAEQLGWLRRGTAPVVDDEGLHPNFSVPYIFRTWAPPYQFVPMYQDEVMAFETPQPRVTHGPPPNPSPPPPQQVIAGPLPDESEGTEITQPVSMHGPPPTSPKQGSTDGTNAAKQSTHPQNG